MELEREKRGRKRVGISTKERDRKRLAERSGAISKNFRNR